LTGVLFAFAAFGTIGGSLTSLLLATTGWIGVGGD
jgi:hypothetical protein